MTTTTVLDIRSGRSVATYPCEPVSAVVCAYAQIIQRDFETWMYHDRYAGMVEHTGAFVLCGRFAARVASPSQQRLVAAARAHGFDCEREGDGSVTVLVPGVRRATGEQCITRERVADMTAMRRTLGY